VSSDLRYRIQAGLARSGIRIGTQPLSTATNILTSYHAGAHGKWAVLLQPIPGFETESFEGIHGINSIDEIVNKVRNKARWVNF
jgi:hypothetical protein